MHPASAVIELKGEAFSRFVECMTEPSEPTESIRQASELLRRFTKIR